MDRIIKRKIEILKNRIKPLKGFKGINRDVQRQSNKLTEYRISQLKIRNDALNDIKAICHTKDFGKIDTYLKKQIKAKNTYKNLYENYENKYNQLKARLGKDNQPTKHAPKLTMDMDNHNNDTNNFDNTMIQSKHNS